MKIIFFGTSNFALPILETLHNHHDIVAVVTTPDAPVGRKQELSESPVSSLARDLEIKLFKPENLKGAVGQALGLQLQELQSDLFVVASYGKIIPEEILALSKHGVLNAHPSLLPKYRGPTPIQTTLLNGDTETGTSIMQLDKEVDHGPILAQEKVPVDPDDNFVTLSDKLARLSGKLLLNAIPEFVSGKLVPNEQDHNAATFTKIITKQDGKIDWTQSSGHAYNKFRAFYPWPGIWTTWNGKTLKITDCAVAHSDATNDASSADSREGEVVEGGQVICGAGTLLQIRSLQLEGKNETDIKSFLNGYKEFVGSRLE